jgi:hypothetical protein
MGPGDEFPQEGDRFGPLDGMSDEELKELLNGENE